MMGCEKCGNKMKLCPFSFGLALGITAGLCKMIFAWSAAMWGYGAIVIDQYASLYYGYGPSLAGGIIGGLWGLIVGFIFGAVIAFIYNFILCHCKSKYCCQKKNGESCK